MKKKNFVILCLRLMGIYFGVLGLSSLPNMTSIFLESPSSPKYILISPLLLIVSGVVLLIFALSLSHFIIEFSETEDNGFHITASEKTSRIALLVLGIFIFSQSLPQLIQIFLLFACALLADIWNRFKAINLSVTAEVKRDEESMNALYVHFGISTVVFTLIVQTCEALNGNQVLFIIVNYVLLIYVYFFSSWFRKTGCFLV